MVNSDKLVVLSEEAAKAPAGVRADEGITDLSKEFVAAAAKRYRAREGKARTLA